MSQAVIALVTVLVLPILAGAQESGQLPTVRGIVADSAGHPLPLVNVNLQLSKRSTQTAEDGQFRIDGVPIGFEVIRLRAVGYRPVELRIAVGSANGWSGTIVLSTMPVQLPELRTVGRYGKPPEYAYTTKYDDFFRRRRLGFGSFITRNEIERRGVMDFEQILQGIPGIRISYGKPAHDLGRLYTRVNLSRCTDLNLALYVDGVHVYWRTPSLLPGSTTREPPEEQLATYLTTMLPRAVELVEVYNGAGQVPSDLDRTACAAIVIWTRQ